MGTRKRRKRRRRRKRKTIYRLEAKNDSTDEKREDNVIQHLQHQIGNQAVQRLLNLNAEDRKLDRSSSNRIKSIALSGIRSAGTSYPHLDKIQQLFGQYDLTNVQAHTASDANGTLGSQAYTMGNDVAFAHKPTLRIAAHEAVHVVQQRVGVTIPDGVGQANDKYERQADRVADEVTAGQSAEGMLNNMTRSSQKSASVQKQDVQFWGPPNTPDHPDFTRDAVDEWNISHPKGTYAHISESMKTRIVDCSDDPDHTGRVLTGTFSDFRIYGDFIAGILGGGKKKRHAEYAAASPAGKKKLYDEAMKSVCASEGQTHGEGIRPNYGNGGSAVNYAYQLLKTNMASSLTLGGGFMSWASAGQLGDAMHCAQDRGSHCEGNRYEGHDDVRDKLGIGNYNTDNPALNTGGKAAAIRNSNQVLAEYARLRQKKRK